MNISPEIKAPLQSSQTGLYDLLMDNGDILNEMGLDTSIQLALLTDSRLDSGDFSGGDDRRGWWGDVLLGIRSGSELWYYTERGKLNDKTLLLAQLSAQEALNRHIVGSGMADSVEVTGSRTADGINWNITVKRNGNSDVYYKYFTLWEGQEKKARSQ